MHDRTIPAPAPMDLDRDAWMNNVNLPDFANCYCHYRDLQRLPSCRRVLIVGPGRGLATVMLRWAKYEVTTLDIDPAFEPDYVGSVHDMNMFTDGRFDAVVASHVLEHLAEPYLDPSLEELARVARYALIYLPVYGRHVHFRLKPGIKSWDWSLVFDVFNFLHKPDGVTPRYQQKQHYWEVGMRGFTAGKMIQRLQRCFSVLFAYRNLDWLYSQNYVLESKRTGTGGNGGPRMPEAKGCRQREDKALTTTAFAEATPRGHGAREHWQT